MWLRMESFVLFISLWSYGLAFTCLDANGNSVDWYSVYKSPENEKSEDWKFKNGLAHFYLDVHSPSWTLSTSGMNESSQAVYQTLSQVYSDKGDNTMYLMYNDEPPKGSASALNVLGHTKGVVAFDKSSGSGFWLIHSTPHFPPNTSLGYTWPHSAREFGQTFLCITFQYAQLGSIAKQLLYNQPIIYNSFVAQSISQDFPTLNDVISGKNPSGPPWFRVIQLQSLGGQEFTSFAKSGKFGADLYDGLVAPTLKQDLLVETWLRSRGTKLDSNCSTEYKVMKITEVALPDQDSFSEERDHSKWAVSFSSGFGQRKVLTFLSLGQWTCIGDINRMVSQFRRGGGTVCLQNPSVWKAFYTSVKKFNKC